MPHENKRSNTNNSFIVPMTQAQMGTYFIGQTPFLSGVNGTTLAALANPCDCCQLIYLNAITITNISDRNIYAEFYLNSCLFNAACSNLISSTNTSYCPLPCPCGQILYSTTPATAPTGGTAVFTRVIEPYSTLVIDGSQIILGSGQSLVVALGGPLPVAVNTTRVAFGWSEVPYLNNNNNNNNERNEHDHDHDHDHREH